MRRIIITIIFLISFHNLFAGPVDMETAKIIAKNFMSKKRSTSNAISNVVTETLNGESLLYIVNFKGGGWVMVSADDVAIPVPSYNLEGDYVMDEENPEAFVELVEGYKEQIYNARRLRSTSPEITKKWNELKTKSTSISRKTYDAGTRLLNVPQRGHVRWDQGENNSGGCSPAYNAFAPSGGPLDGCECGKTPVGCGAVAMGQVMWYWQWPLNSSYRSYNWNLMPPTLTNGASVVEGNEIAHLLRDCGLAANTHYNCIGSWTTMDNIEDALRNTFNLKSARKNIKSHWSGSAWNDLIRSEIDCERPVIYRGDKRDLSTEKHIFVIDGYDISDPDYFLFNFGWGSSRNNLSMHHLGDITPGEYDFNKNQMAIVGISPTYYSPGKEHISDVSYSIVTENKSEEAKQTIILPAPNKGLIIENGGNLTLTSGNSITIKPGFHAKQGSHAFIKTNPAYVNEMEINITTCPNVFTPDGDGYNDDFGMVVENANSFQFQLFDRYGEGIFESAGLIHGNRASLWDGSGFSQTTYFYAVRFKNNFGRMVERTGSVFLQRDGYRSASVNDSVNNEQLQIKTLSLNKEEKSLDFDVVIFPNPNNGNVNVSVDGEYLDYNIKVYTASGSLVYQRTKLSEPIHTFDMNSSVDGTYIIKIETNNNVISKKMILKH